MNQRPNPLTDELSDDAKAELSAMFAQMARQFHSAPNIPSGMAVRLIQQRQPWDRL